MKPKTIILAVVAVTCGLGASWMTSNLLASKNNAEAETVKLVLASKQLNIGETIKNPETMFYIKEVPKESVSNPKALLADNDEMMKEKLKSRIIKKPLRKDDWIDLDDNTYDSKDPAGGFNYSLPAGMRAIGIRVNNKTSVGGFANLPLSRVDILHSMRRGNDKDSYVQVLLENVLVLAADAVDQRMEGGGKAIPASVVTVAVSPKDAMRVTLAEETGNMTFVVRKIGDYSRYAVTKLNLEEVRNDLEPSLTKESDNEPMPETEAPLAPVLPPAPKADEPVIAADAPPPSAPAAPAVVAKIEQPKWKNHTMEIIEGDNIRKVPFKLDPKTNRPPQEQEVTKTDLTDENGDLAPPPLTPAPAVAPTPPEPKPTPKPATPKPKSRDDDSNY